MTTLTARKFKDSLIVALVLITASFASSCYDEIGLPSGLAPEEGLPATVELKWDTEAALHLTRAQLTDNDANNINTLWVGIYDWADGGNGRLITQAFVTPGRAFTDESGNSTADIERKTLRIKTTSGRRRIVAVANVQTNYGITDNSELRAALEDDSGPAQLWSLSDLLEKADTWEKFRSVSACLTDSSSVTLVSSNLVMSGIYTEDSASGDMQHPSSWVDANQNTYVDIYTGANKLGGTVHLRRLQSYIRFNFIPEPGFVTDEDGNPTSQRITDMVIEPQSWHVNNVPIISYLHEQDKNAADVSRHFISDKIPDNYGISPVSFRFSTGEIETADHKPVTVTGSKVQATGAWFDFHLYENKRMGLDHVKKYSDREKEYKDASSGDNTGIYSSLCPSVNQTDNNYGTFVTVKLKLSYSYTNSAGQKVNRTAYPVYTIHLGFCEGENEAQKARDFNCRRNSRYTYNVRITDVNNIKVEAMKLGDDEPQPGAEGSVIDSYDNLITLDAHYCAWNIKISNQARNNMVVEMLTWFKGRSYNFSNQPESRTGEIFDLNQAMALGEGFTMFHHQMVDWVTIMPTDNENTIPNYQPTVKADGSTGSWDLLQFSDPVSYPHPKDKQHDPTDETERWYTVFFNEYVYAYDTSGNLMINEHTGGEGGWWNYVNQPSRFLWLSVNPNNISTDGESSYSKSLYVFEQKSIQTYYSEVSPTENGTGMGMEHTNETFGVNFRWTWNPANGLNSENGRWNVQQYVTSRGDRWDQVIGNKRLHIPAISEQHKTSTKPVTHPVPTLTAGKMDNNQWLATDPQKTTEYYEMVNACMNRNRDNNGDGMIDNDELRWYVPTTGKYLRLIVGRESMASPLMVYNESNTELPYGTDWPANAKNTRFHYFSSNQQFLWSEEGLSITKSITTGANLKDNTSLTKWAPWQVRCVRNLGINLSAVLDVDPTERAYHINEDTRIVDLDHYDASSLRISIGTKLPPHKVSEDANTLSRRFQYASDPIIVTLKNGSKANNIAAWKRQLADSNPCGNYSENGDDAGWRVPNQKELAVLRQNGIIKQVVSGTSFNPAEYLTCTYEFFGNHRFMGAVVDQSQALDMQDGNYVVLCVRDIISGPMSAETKTQPRPKTSAAPNRAPDFSFETREGRRRRLSDSQGHMTLLLFYNPDCDHCRDAVALLRSDPWLTRMVRKGNVEVLAVDAEEDFDYWQRTAGYLPEEWTVAYDRSSVLDRGLYNLNSMPVIHLLDSDGTILLDDATPAQALICLKRIASAPDTN